MGGGRTHHLLNFVISETWDRIRTTYALPLIYKYAKHHIYSEYLFKLINCLTANQPIFWCIPML